MGKREIDLCNAICRKHIESGGKFLQSAFFYLDCMECLGLDPKTPAEAAEVIYQLRQYGYEILADMLEDGYRQICDIADAIAEGEE